MLPTGWHKHPYKTQVNNDDRVDEGTNSSYSKVNDIYDGEFDTASSRENLDGFKPLINEPIYYTLSNFRNYQKQQEQSFSLPSYQNSLQKKCGDDSTKQMRFLNNKLFASTENQFRGKTRINSSKNKISSLLVANSSEPSCTTVRSNDITVADAMKILHHTDDSNKKKKNYNSNVIKRSTSCVNSKLEAISQRIMFKGREHNLNKAQTSFSSNCGISPKNGDNESYDFGNKRDSLKKQQDSDRLSVQNNVSKSNCKDNEPIEVNDISENQTNILTYRNPTMDNVECGEMKSLLTSTVSQNMRKFSDDKSKLSSPSRLLRRRHTTYIKEQGKSKSSSNISTREDHENELNEEKIINDHQFSSASLNRTYLRMRDHLKKCETEFGCEPPTSLDDNMKLNSDEKYHRDNSIRYNAKIPTNCTQHQPFKVRYLYFLVHS